MRFQDYLQETVTTASGDKPGGIVTYDVHAGYTQKQLETLFGKLERNCQPILQFYKKHGTRRVFTRMASIEGPPNTIYGEKKARGDRMPTDTPKWLHAMIDDALHKRFGWYPRTNGVFTWYDVDEIFLGASSRKTMLFFPIGEFKYVWSPVVSDLYLHMVNTLSDNISTTYRSSKQTEEDKIEIKNWVEETADSYQDNEVEKNFYRCEVMFKCDSYYLVNYDSSVIFRELPRMTA